jgi:hypothetical protein
MPRLKGSWKTSSVCFVPLCVWADGTERSSQGRKLDIIDVCAMTPENLLDMLKRVAEQQSGVGFEKLSVSLFFSVGAKDVLSPESTLVVFREGIALASKSKVKFFHAWQHIRSFLPEVESSRKSLAGYVFVCGGKHDRLQVLTFQSVRDKTTFIDTVEALTGSAHVMVQLPVRGSDSLSVVPNRLCGAQRDSTSSPLVRQLQSKTSEAGSSSRGASPKRTSDARMVDEVAHIASFFVDGPGEDTDNEPEFPAVLFHDIMMRSLLNGTRGTIIVFKQGIGFFSQNRVCFFHPWSKVRGWGDAPHDALCNCTAPEHERRLGC